MSENPESNESLPRRRDLPSRVVGKEVLVREPGIGKVHFLNPTAALVWECCDGKTSARECERRMRAAFTIAAEADIAADIRQTVADFAQRGLIDA